MTKFKLEKGQKGPIIGAVQINTPFTRHNNSFECAAWWQDEEAQLRVHPVYLGRSYHHPQLLTITALIKGKVVNDYFPGLWGGVPISREPYKPKHLGEETIIHRGIGVIDAVQRTGSSPGGDGMDWFIHPSWWEVFKEEALTELRENYKRLPEFWTAWDDMNPETWQPNKHQTDLHWGFDDEYKSRVGMIAHFGGLLEKWSRIIEKITWYQQYHKVGGRYDTAYQRELFAKNTEWTKAIPIQVYE